MKYIFKVIIDVGRDIEEVIDISNSVWMKLNKLIMSFSITYTMVDMLNKPEIITEIISYMFSSC
ncbi:MAG: hypothetical protein KatS3mg003_1118 [Candidatus Nitrosocaldaceae archaeon]|nr:MAG: hypothetical protein KatS3mg003_1118 [Candidatus Nitrosocaldaceae archaeon]